MEFSGYVVFLGLGSGMSLIISCYESLLSFNFLMHIIYNFAFFS